MVPALPHARRGRIALAGVAAAALLAPVAAVAIGQDHEDNLPEVLDAVDESALDGRNVILLIGDGMDDTAITLTRNYEVGAAGRLAIDEFPFTGAMTTYSVEQDDPSVPNYVPESASTASAWATGQQTYNGAISVLPDGTPVDSTLDLANAAGYLTGVVTTSEIQDATPAVQVASVPSRGCKGPDSMADCPDEDVRNGGPGSISEQLIASGAHLVLGGGKAPLEERIRGGADAGKTVWQVADEQGWDTVSTARELRRVRGDQPVLGAFAPGNLDLEYVGPTPTTEGTEPQSCQLNPDRDRTQPSLSELTETSLDILDEQTNAAPASFGADAAPEERPSWRDRAEAGAESTSSGDGRGSRGQQDDGPGFFLQVEGASIDKQAHAANPCGQIGENAEFDEAVRVALDYQEAYPDTLVIVTGDHSHTPQIVPAGSTTPGLTASLITAEDAVMTLSYATADEPGAMQHTGSQIRIAAKGPQASNVLGVTHQTEVFSTIARALGLETGG